MISMLIYIDVCIYIILLLHTERQAQGGRGQHPRRVHPGGPHRCHKRQGI